MAKILMVIPPERFRDEELFVTKNELESHGHYVAISSTKIGKIYGSRGGNITSTITIDNMDINNFDGVIFVGGGGSKLLFNNQTALQIAKSMFEQDKVVSAICLAPVILANAGILVGKNATVAGTETKTIESKGAKYTGPGVTVDGKIITGNAPKVSKLFAEKIIEILKKSNQ